MTIYDIDREIERILSMTDEETGELPDSAFEELEQLQLDRQTKIDNAGCLFLELQAEAKAIADQEAVLEERRRAKQRRADRIKRYLEFATGGQPFATDRVEMKWRRSTKVEIDDALFMQRPEERFLRQRQPEPDKDAIKRALKAGELICGAALIESKSLTIK